MLIPRTHATRWFEISEQFPVLPLTGPRQVGKTTLLQDAQGPTRKYALLDDPTLRALATEDPALFLQRFPPPVLIDEIQYAPQMLPFIKLAVDEARTPGLFWLTGSQRFQMMKGVSESLAGRVAIMHLLGFSGRERRRLEPGVPPFPPPRFTHSIPSIGSRPWSAGGQRNAVEPGAGY